MIKLLAREILLGVILAATAQAAWAQGSVACIVSGLDGEVLVIRETGDSQPLTKFKKLLAGDSVVLPKGASIRLSYLPLGKSESWQGPAKLKIQPHEALDLDTAQRPTVISLGVDVASIKESPLLREQKELVAGQFNVRTFHTKKGPGTASEAPQPVDASLNSTQKRELEALKRQYLVLVKKFPSGDATPHLYYLAELQRLNQKASMAEHIRLLLQTEKDNPGLVALLRSL